MPGFLDMMTKNKNFNMFGYVECGPCTGRKQKAIKSCVECMDSYCPIHFEIHEELHSGQHHKVTNATRFLQDKICSRHGKLLEVFCCLDQQCVCLSCTMDNHKGHRIVSALAERTEKQSLISEPKMKSQQRILDRKRELGDMQKAVESHKRSAKAALDDTEKTFTEMICFIKKKCSEVQNLIQTQQKIAVSRAEHLMKQMEEEIANLQRQDEELQQLSLTEDDVHFLQRYVVLTATHGSSELPSITVNSVLSFEEAAKSVTELKKHLEDFCKSGMEKIENRVKQIQILTPMTRDEVLQYYCELTMDPNTAYRRLSLSEGNRVVSNSDRDLPYPDHPERFDWPQVLCEQPVCGRFYWEVEWCGENGVNIAVSYKSICRKGGHNECWFGCSEQSWRLYCSQHRYAFRHHGKEKYIPKTNNSTRIGVYVDYKAGSLSFYSIDGKMILLYKVQCEFTEPLYPGFTVWPGSKLTLCSPTNVK